MNKNGKWNKQCPKVNKIMVSKWLPMYYFTSNQEFCDQQIKPINCVHPFHGSTAMWQFCDKCDRNAWSSLNKKTDKNSLTGQFVSLLLFLTILSIIIWSVYEIPVLDLLSNNIVLYLKSNKIIPILIFIILVSLIIVITLIYCFVKCLNIIIKCTCFANSNI
jgi:hypothetical protein